MTRSVPVLLLPLGAAAAAQAQSALIVGPQIELSSPPPLAPGIDPALEAAAEQALKTHPAVGAARRSIQASQYEVSAARWLRYPSISVEATTRSDKLGIRPELQVVQPLWSGGRIGQGIARAKAGERAAEAQRAETALDLLIRLSDAYYELGRTAELASLYEQSLAEHERLVASMQRRVDQEVSPRSDLELARARAAQVAQDLGLVRGQHEAALRRFAQIVGSDAFQPPAAPVYSPAAHHRVGSDAISRAQTCHPTVARLDAEIAVAEAERRISKAQILPQVGLQYRYDRFAGHQVGLALRAQTSGGLSPVATAEAAAARRQAAELNLSTARLEIGEAVALDLVQNRSARDRLTSGSIAAETTAHVTESFLRQFVAGRRTWLDVMNSVREAIAAQAQLTELHSTAMATSARIHLRACDWRPAGL